MFVLKKLFPDLRYKTINDIEIELLVKKGIKFAILDIDNTLVPYTMKKPNEYAISFLNKLKDNGIEFSFVSNNHKERIETFNKEINAVGVYNAKKPLLYGINKAMKKMGSDCKNTVLIGDQVFTDMLGGNRAGMLTILVEPIKEVNTLFFKFKRYFEKKILVLYEKRYK